MSLLAGAVFRLVFFGTLAAAIVVSDLVARATADEVTELRYSWPSGPSATPATRASAPTDP